MKPAREEIRDPYWALPDDREPWPGNDFNRELLRPGTSDVFPAGAVGIRIDDDFWSVAALPWSWRNYTTQEIVTALWPSRAGSALYMPDSVAAKSSNRETP